MVLPKYGGYVVFMPDKYKMQRKPNITSNSKYIQRKFIPRNVEKYVGNPADIVARSSWELRLMKFLDETPSILQWSSETIVIPYLSPADGAMHRYFVDFVIMYRTKDGEIKKSLIEVKPDKQTRPPQPSKNRKRQLKEMETYAVNQAKWRAAHKFAAKNDMNFLVLTEHHLGIK